MKNVLYLTYDGLTDPLGQSQILPYVKALSKKGFTFTILSCDKPDKYSKLKDTIENLCKEDNIQWVSFAFSNKIPVLSKIIDRYRFKKIAIQLHKKNAYSLVHCRSYVSAEIGLYFKKNFGTKFLFDMRGFWADERVEGGSWSLKNPLYRALYKYYKQKELQFFTNADYTISLTEAGKNEIQSWKTIRNNPIRIKVIPCCVDTSLFDKENVTKEDFIKYRNALSINDGSYILLYLGSLGTWYLLNDMLDFFKELLLKKPNAKFLFVTADDAEQIKTAALSKGIHEANIVITKAQRKEVPLYIKMANASVFFINPSFSKKASSPTKQGEIMAMGVPIICNNGVGDTAEIVNKFNAGIVIKSFNNSEYKRCIEALLNKSFDAVDLRNGAKEFYGLEKGVEKYHDVYKACLEKK
jgi:glycosyltransferase involved in cell wall biosynthesis